MPVFSKSSGIAYYPDVGGETCAHDERHTKFDILYDSLEECVSGLVCHLAMSTPILPSGLILSRQFASPCAHLVSPCLHFLLIQCKFPYLDEATCLSGSKKATPTRRPVFRESSGSSDSGVHSINCSYASREQCEARTPQCTWHKKRGCQACTDCMVSNGASWNEGSRGGSDDAGRCSFASRAECEAHPAWCTWHKKRKCEPCDDCGVVSNGDFWKHDNRDSRDDLVDCLSADRAECEAHSTQCTWHKKLGCEPCTDCMTPNSAPWNNDNPGSSEDPVDCFSADREECEARPAQCTWHKKRRCEPCTDCMTLHRAPSEPLPKPTKTSTPEPTRRPTPKPTKRPTPKPTRRPTPKPTKKPTRKPVSIYLDVQLSSWPTFSPTTEAPTLPLPTQGPTWNPTRFPTQVSSFVRCL